MPYISQDKRLVLDRAINEIHHKLVELETDDCENNMEGNVNYIFTRLLLMVYGNDESTSYSQINDALGVLSAVTNEFYRKVAAPYENQKEFVNGPIVRFLTPGEIVSHVNVEIPE